MFLILDLDVHQGDGTAEIFEQDDRVFTVSMHGLNNFPFRKKASNWDIAFENEAGDEEYLESLTKVLDHLRSMNFDLLFLPSRSGWACYRCPWFTFFISERACEEKSVSHGLAGGNEYTDAGFYGWRVCKPH